jgi:transposase-like protein
MSITVGYSVDEIRAFVEEYEAQPRGTKGQWLEGQPVSAGQLHRWRRTLVLGDLDRGLVPREAGLMVSSPNSRGPVNRVRSAQQAQQAEVDRLQARVRELEATNEALGKAIGLLHSRSEQEPDERSATKEPPTS